MAGTLICLVLLILVFGPLIYISNRNERERMRLEQAAKARLEQARIAYYEMLEQLKQSPTDASIKQQALSLGRAYAGLTREQSAVTIYDEMALLNDINAATAGATARPSVEQRLQELAQLQSKGLLSADEYTTQRQRLLKEL